MPRLFEDFSGGAVDIYRVKHHILEDNATFGLKSCCGNVKHFINCITQKLFHWCDCEMFLYHGVRPSNERSCYGGEESEIGLDDHRGLIGKNGINTVDLIGCCVGKYACLDKGDFAPSKLRKASRKSKWGWF